MEGATEIWDHEQGELSDTVMCQGSENKLVYKTNTKLLYNGARAERTPLDLLIGILESEQEGQ